MAKCQVAVVYGSKEDVLLVLFCLMPFKIKQSKMASVLCVSGKNYLYQCTSSNKIDRQRKT